MEEKKLAKGSLGFLSSIIMGIACSAPAYSIETAATTLILALGVLSPQVVLYAGIVMLMMTFAFKNFNSIKPNAGGCYIWVSDTFGKMFGFLSGWALLVYCAIFMVSATVPVSNSLLILFDKEHVNDTNYIAVISAIMLTIVSAVVLKGIKASAWFQNLIFIVEFILLAIIAIAGFKVFGQNPVQAFSWAWFSPLPLSSTSFMQGISIAVFFYAGWDIVINLSEETKDSGSIPGRSAFWSVVALIFIFTVFVTLSVMGLTASEMEHYNTNIIYAIADKLYGEEFAILAIVAVVLSTIGTIETSIIQFSRVLFAKSRDGMAHKMFSKIHDKWLTPHYAIITIWVLGLVFIFLSSFVNSINHLLSILVLSIGVQFSFYISLTAFAAAWHFRKHYKDGFSVLMTRIVLPLFAGSILITSIIYASLSADWITNAVGIGGILIGLIPYYLYSRKSKTI